jgi:hypothetical protein
MSYGGSKRGGRCEIAGAQLSSMTLYNASSSFVDVHIIKTGGFNSFSWSFGGFKRAGEYDIAYAQKFSYMANQRDLKFCTMLHCHL